MRVSPDTRVIALSAFEDRPTVLEMLRAGAVGYLVKGTAARRSRSIQKVMAGGASLSSEVIAASCTSSPGSSARGGAHEERDARRGEIERFVAGEGLSMVFQPIVELATRTPSGSRRWPGSARSRSTAERMVRRGRPAGVRRAAGAHHDPQALRELDRVPEGAYLAVNCSHRAATSSQLARLLGSDAGRIVVEITEHEAVEDYDALVTALAPLREMGVRIAIDDAGAGFASMRHTLRITPDIVKIDISLTREIDTDRAKRALASALISFAEEMDIAIVAEGIETVEELETLRELGRSLRSGLLPGRTQLRCGDLAAAQRS